MPDQSTISKEEIRKLALAMNEELELYTPDGIANEVDLRMYDDFFAYCRQSFFIYRSLTKEEIKQYFISFYNSNYKGKAEILTQIENRTQVFISNLIQEREDEEEESDQRRLDFYLAQTNEVDRVLALFYLENGVFPEPEFDLTEYVNKMRKIEDELDQAELVSNTFEDVSREPQEIVTPEDIVSRYIKGSGVYDPAIRNSGFRVDTDIEK